jgi:hypothetical protein
MSGARVTSSAGAALDPLPAEGRSEAQQSNATDPSALTASPDPSYGGNPPQRRKPPAAAYSDDPPATLDEPPGGGERGMTPADGARPGASPSAIAPADSAGPLDPGAPAMPSVSLDRITSAIGENARHKADSLGRKTISVKPPDFDKP